MVLIRAKSKDVGLLRRRRGSNSSFNNEQLVLLLLTFIFVGYLVYSVYAGAKSIAERNGTNSSGMVRKADQQKAFAAGQDSRSVSLHLDRPEAFENADYMDAEAADIRKLLKCDVLLDNHKGGFVNGYLLYGAKNKADDEDITRADGAGETVDNSSNSTTPNSTVNVVQQRRRRLQEEGQDKATTTENMPVMEDDQYNGFMDGDDGAEVTAAHLFCLAAYTANDAIVTYWQDKINCPVLADEDTHKGLIDLWSTVRTEILDEILLTQTLSLSTERYVTIAHQSLNVWAPPGDSGTSYMMASLQQQVDEKEGIGNLHDNLGKDRLFVDMGSGLGYTAMTVSILYPDTTVVSMEAAPTNWLLQQLNWRCNNVLPRPKAVLKVGVAPSSTTSQVAHFIWRPTSTSSTRAWSLNMEDEHKNSNREQDLEFSVQLLPWHKLLLLAEIVDHTIDVLNLDCEGCEYNLIPALSDQEFQTISSILGELHWSYIPRLKRPSSGRAKITHGRLCGHEDFAKDAIECCAFPYTPVRATVSGEVLVRDTDHQPPVPVTVADLIGESHCPRFEKWAAEKDLFNIESDWAWFQVDSLNTAT